MATYLELLLARPRAALLLVLLAAPLLGPERRRCSEHPPAANHGQPERTQPHWGRHPLWSRIQPAGQHGLPWPSPAAAQISKTNAADNTVIWSTQMFVFVAAWMRQGKLGLDIDLLLLLLCSSAGGDGSCAKVVEVKTARGILLCAL